MTATYFVVDYQGAPRYVVRYDPEGLGVPERWSGREWFDSPLDVDVVFGGEPSRQVSEAEATALIAGGKLLTLSPQDVHKLEGHY